MQPSKKIIEPDIDSGLSRVQASATAQAVWDGVQSEHLSRTPRRQCDRDPAERSEIAAASDTVHPTARSRQVHVVDDEPMIRDVLSEALLTVGYNATTASNGRSALELLDGVTPDVIVLD